MHLTFISLTSPVKLHIPIAVIALAAIPLAIWFGMSRPEETSALPGKSYHQAVAIQTSIQAPAKPQEPQPTTPADTIARFPNKLQKQPFSQPQLLTPSAVAPEQIASVENVPSDKGRPESASSYQRKASAPTTIDPSQPAAVHPASPGATLLVQNQQVTVDGYLPLPKSTGSALSVEITPVPNEPTSSDTTNISAANPRKRSAGLTYEEQLFRARWGWAAYDSVRRAAMENNQPAQ